MRTLSRPMFNMGGPIKQGIMDGIREPYKHGGPTGTGLVGDQRYPNTGGREHHAFFIPPLWAAATGLARFAPNIYRAAQAGLKAGKFGRTYNLGKIGGAGSGATGAGAMGTSGAATNVGKQLMNIKQQGMGSKFMGGLPPWLRTSIERDPIFKGGKWIKEAIMGPTAKTFGKKIVQGATTPTGALTIGYFGGKWLWPDGTEATDKEVKQELNKKKGDKDYGPHTKGGPTITAAMREEKAKADKEKRINALLDTMGYDKARKNAAYDALIDAGRMVNERGTLDPKNIGRELIDPIVAATSARFDKPEQIREAVGLMQVKADIQKEMTKDETELANKVKRMNLRIGEKTLAGDTLNETIEKYRLRQGTPTGETLAAIARGEGIEAKVLYEKVPKNTDALEFITEVVTKSHEDGKPFPPGDYVISDRIISIDAEGNVKPYH